MRHKLPKRAKDPLPQNLELKTEPIAPRSPPIP